MTSPPEALRELFAYREQHEYPPRFNIAPTQPISVVHMTQGERHIALMRWGLVPAWVKDPRTFALLFNARGESITEKPAFRNAMKRRRCLIPADGFYEWKSVGGRKQPFYVHAKSGGPFAFAGIYETWTGPNGEELDTAAIVTTRANRTLSPIHDRMPVIVPAEAFDLWLDCTAVDDVMASTLIAPAPDDLLEAYEVSAAVNRTASDGPELLRQAAADSVSAPKPRRTAARKRAARDDGQGALF